MIKQSSVIFSKDSADTGAVQVAPEVTQDEQTAAEKVSKKLDRIADSSSRILYELRAVFPFNFFPDEIIIDETKVTIVSHMFFQSKETHSVMYQDIFNVVVDDSLFFATMIIADRFFSKVPTKVTYLKKAEALKAMRIILGMMVILKEKVNTQPLPLEELREKAERIGEAR
jgi:hypothetical protein